MPDWRDAVRRRLAPLGLDAAHAEDIVEEMAQHLDDRHAELRGRGLSEDDARRTVLAELDARELRPRDLARRRPRPAPALEAGGGSTAALRLDVRHALRRMRLEPGFATSAVLIVAIGVAAATAVFSVLSPLLLRPLPFREPERLVWIALGTGEGLSAQTSRAFNLRDYRLQARSFEAITGYNAFFEYDSYNLTGSGAPERLVGVPVAQDFLDVLGVRPALGRSFVAEEGVWGGRPAVILTHGFWTRRFGADPTIVGRAITLNGTPRAVVGVLPKSFDFASTFAPASRVDFLLPHPIAPETDRHGNELFMIGRLRPGATVRAAQAELDVVNARLKAAEPQRWGLEAVASELHEHIAGAFRSALLLLAAGAGLVLVVACANLSNLLLARAQSRQREMAVRSALGASRARLVRQLLVESVVLALGGGLLGVVLATLATRWVAGASALKIPLLATVAVDARAAAFSVVVTLLVGLAVGVLPALQAARGGEAAALRDGGRGASQGRRRVAAREALVVAEVAVACALLVAGGLLLRSFARVLQVDLGFRPDGVVAWQLNPSREFANDTQAVAFYSALAARVAAAPGAAVVGLTDTPPLGRNRSWGGRGEGVEYQKDEYIDFFPRLVDDRYLQAMSIPLVAGRYLTADDDADAPRVVVINRSAADAAFNGADPLGRILLLAGGKWRVAGVVADVRHQAVERTSGAEAYFPMRQLFFGHAMVMVVRSPLPAASLAPGVSAALRAVDPAMPADDWRPFETVVDRALSPRRFILQVLGAFAGVALLLAALGLYAVLSYTVSQRANEIGIRMALGETAAQVRRRVVARTLALAALGVAAGSAAALAGRRLVATLLFDVGATDLATFLGTAAVLLAVAALASWLPARRASHTDPAVALRAG